MKKVCIVDDDKSGLNVLKNRLGDLCELLTYSSPIKFLKDYISGEISADILIVDLIMPDFSGAEVVRKLRELDLVNNTKIYIYTSLCDCSYVLSELNIDGHIIKSRDSFEELVNIIKEN